MKRSVGDRYWALADQGMQSATNFATMVLAARALDVQSFAHFSLAYLAVLFALSFHRTWVTQPMNVLGAQRPEELSARARALWRAHAMLVPAGAVLCVAVAMFAFRDLWLLLATVAYLALYFLQEMQRRYAYTLFRIRDAGLTSLVMGCVQLAGMAALMFSGWSSGTNWMLALLLGQAGGLVTGLMLVGFPRNVLNGSEMGAVEVLSAQFSHSRWIIASQLVYWASSQAYPFMIAGVDTAQAAAFNAGMSILNAANVVRMTLANYLPAHAGRVLAREGADALRNFARSALFRIAVTGALIWPVLLLLGTPLVELLYGSKFAGADKVLEWVALGMWASMFSVVLNAVALALDTTRNVFISNAAGALFSCTVGAYLTLTYGLVGAIWANVAGYVIPAVMQATHMWPHLKTRG